MADGGIIFVGIPVAIVFVTAVAIGVKKGFKYGAVAFVLGLVAVVLCLIALVAFYYANGGH